MELERRKELGFRFEAILKRQLELKEEDEKNREEHQVRIPGNGITRDVIVPAFPGTLLLSQWIATKAIPGKTGTNHIPEEQNDKLTVHTTWG